MPALWSTWSPHIRGVDYPGERLRAATSGRVRGPFELRVAFTVDEVDEAARTWSWTVHVGRIAVVLRHGVQAVDGGSRTWLRIDGPGPLLAAYAPVARFALGRLVRPDRQGSGSGPGQVGRPP